MKHDINDETSLFTIPDETTNPEPVTTPDPKPVNNDNAPKSINVVSLVNAIKKDGEARLSDHAEPVKPAPAPAKKPGKKKESANTDKKEKARMEADKKILATDGMAAYLKDFLDKKAKENAEFAKVYANPKKSLSECVLYITQEIFSTINRQGLLAVGNDKIEGLAMHYYQEEDLKPKEIKGNIAMAVLLQGMPIPEDDFKKLNDIAIEEKRKEIIEEKKKEYAQSIKDGKTKIQLTEEEQRAIDEAGREALIEMSSKRQKTLSTRSKAKTNEPQKADEQQNLLFNL